MTLTSMFVELRISNFFFFFIKKTLFCLGLWELGQPGGPEPKWLIIFKSQDLLPTKWWIYTKLQLYMS